MGTVRCIHSKRLSYFVFLEGELEDEVVELQQCNGDLSALRAERDATAGAFFPLLSPGKKLASSDKIKDKQRDLQDMERVLKELTVLLSSFWFCVCSLVMLGVLV